ncbi:carboxypeptidase-like regulatory domain-containing protein [Actinoallomurus sp. NPDC052308]|uniref:carboxypeptidase-like regulatory domain-containing protein n=1 Tax=Actinoallomurus sp. NPDC052308 TaxID=3155530 RepID=UPI0034289922
MGILVLLLGFPTISAHADIAGTKVQPTLTISADPTSVDPDHPTAEISGQVTVPDGSGGTVGVPGLAVDLSANAGWGSITDAVTDQTGHYTATFVPAGEDTDDVNVWANTAETSDYAAAYSGTLLVHLAKAETRISLSPDRTTAVEGTKIGLSGTVERESATGWQPAAGVSVSLYGTAAGCWPPSQTVAADTAGHFQALLPLPCTGTFTARAHGTLYQPSQATTGTIAIQQAVHFKSGASIDVYGNVTVGGSVNVDYPSGSFAGKPLAIQYSADAGKWTTIKKITFNDNGYTTRFWYGRSGYWRAVFAGDTQYAPATSAASKAWRWNTRLESVKFAPKKVRKNHYITASGKLTRAVSKTKRTGYAGQKIEIAFRFKGKKTWYHLAWGKTDKYGRFSKKVKAHGSGYYQVIFRGGADTFADWTDGKAYVRTSALGAYTAITPDRPTPPAPITGRL